MRFGLCNSDVGREAYIRRRFQDARSGSLPTLPCVNACALFLNAVVCTTYLNSTGISLPKFESLEMASRPSFP